ncbi:hypothetical protein P3X46_028621 [Hevea brasiliensis]|uniref:C2H2-type domain-containing protein n=1 Tax=Hevea brasiliensis TaxID=3981 RepID=A0ABQ9KT01_HEVBR|nr:uncharacterized protein LOC110665567 [Hevea brasiliensis]KAJ9146342.1 hypothetical protein P3X46_028621 [Hevea brasiliensis]
MAKPKPPIKPIKEIHQNQNQHPQKSEKPPSWFVVRSLFTCKDQQRQQQQQQQQELKQQRQPQQEKQEQQKKKEKKHHQHQEQALEEITSKKCKKIKCSGSLCSNTKVMHRPETASPEVLKKRASMGLSSSNDTSSRSMKVPLNEINGVPSSTNSLVSVSSNSSINNVGSFRGMPFRRLSGCYECRMVVDPVLGFTRDPSLRSSICSCPECGEIFVKAENLELHQAFRHAVSELGPEDTSKNIVEIIFQSSWLKKQAPICQIDRILKVHNTQRTISKFEEYRDSIKAKATKFPKKHPRCIADGNELLRFYCTSFACSLGLNGSSNLCNSIPRCNVCSIIKNGFKESSSTEGVNGNGILTTATSGKAHDKAAILEESNGNSDKRAMLVCRVIAGRVKKSAEGNMEEYDSLAGAVGVYSNLDELYVFNARAILPCFVVIYSGF